MAAILNNPSKDKDVVGKVSTYVPSRDSLRAQVAELRRLGWIITSPPPGKRRGKAAVQ